MNKNTTQYKLVALNTAIPMPAETVNPHVGNAKKIAFTLQLGFLVHNIMTEWNKPADEQDVLKLVTSTTALMGMLLQNQHLQSANSFFRTGMYAVDTLQVAARVLANIASTPFFVVGALASQTAKLCGFSEWLGKQTANAAKGYLSENVIPYIKELLPLVAYTVLPGVTVEGENGVRVNTILGPIDHDFSETDDSVFFDAQEFHEPEDKEYPQDHRMSRRDLNPLGQNVTTIVGPVGSNFGYDIASLSGNKLAVSAPYNQNGTGEVFVLPTDVDANLTTGRLPDGAIRIRGNVVGRLAACDLKGNDGKPELYVRGSDGIRRVDVSEFSPSFIDLTQIPVLNGTTSGDGLSLTCAKFNGSDVLLVSTNTGDVHGITELGVRFTLSSQGNSTAVTAISSDGEGTFYVGKRLGGTPATAGQVDTFTVDEFGGVEHTNTRVGAPGARFGAAISNVITADGHPIEIVGATGEGNGAIHTLKDGIQASSISGDKPAGLFGAPIIIHGGKVISSATGAGVVYSISVDSQGKLSPNISDATEYVGEAGFGTSLASIENALVIGNFRLSKVLIYHDPSTPVDPASSSSGGTNLAAIIGAVIGGIGSLVVIGGVLYCACHKKPTQVDHMPEQDNRFDDIENPAFRPGAWQEAVHIEGGHPAAADYADLAQGHRLAASDLNYQQISSSTSDTDLASHQYEYQAFLDGHPAAYQVFRDELPYEVPVGNTANQRTLRRPPHGTAQPTYEEPLSLNPNYQSPALLQHPQDPVIAAYEAPFDGPGSLNPNYQSPANAPNHYEFAGDEDA